MSWRVLSLNFGGKKGMVKEVYTGVFRGIYAS